jgi:hypothetical protein
MMGKAEETKPTGPLESVRAGFRTHEPEATGQAASQELEETKPTGPLESAKGRIQESGVRRAANSG